MTTAERVRMHIQIERENKRKQEEFQSCFSEFSERQIGECYKIFININEMMKEGCPIRLCGEKVEV